MDAGEGEYHELIDPDLGSPSVHEKPAVYRATGTELQIVACRYHHGI
ncbi:MAG TPA: hypothetical protein VFL78_11905 [Rhodanobacteraceae bacterium]|nr:hypothetical protein [Rhodanobacteraceae bacterium]